jgi:phenylalanyl-tRNA synthetase alpha subunit
VAYKLILIKPLKEISILKKLLSCIKKNFTVYEAKLNEMDGVKTLIRKKILRHQKNKLFIIMGVEDLILKELKGFQNLQKKIKKGDLTITPEEQKWVLNKKYRVFIPEFRDSPRTKSILLDLTAKILHYFIDKKGYCLVSPEGLEEISSIENFDSLFLPLDHIARGSHDTFYTASKPKIIDTHLMTRIAHEFSYDKKGLPSWGFYKKNNQNVLRTHLTPCILKKRLTITHPKLIMLGRVFRAENTDRTHLPEFNQVELSIVDKTWTIETFIKEVSDFVYWLGFKSIRLQPRFFLYTEPSFELYADNLEFLGGGEFRDEVKKIFNIKESLFGCAFGLERLAMILYKIRDIRRLYK